MKRILRVLSVIIESLFLTSGAVYAAEEKPLPPGWLSLDGSVGLADKAIGDGKSVIEKALGVSISGFLDAGWTLSTNHPRRPDFISLRYFDRDQNKVVFNGFNVKIDKPEKDWGGGV